MAGSREKLLGEKKSCWVKRRVPGQLIGQDYCCWVKTRVTRSRKEWLGQEDSNLV